MAEREDTPAEHGSSKVKLKKPRSGLFYFFFSKNKKVKRRRRRRRRGRSRRRTEHSYIALFFLFLRLVFHVVLESKPWETWQQFPHSHSKLLVVSSSNVQKLKKKKRRRKEVETEVGRKQTDADEKYIYTIIDYRQMKCSIPHIFSKKRNGQSRRISNHPPVGPSPKTVQEKNAGTIRRAKMSKKLKWARPIVSSFIYFFFQFPPKEICAV
jgi:hypothetical protein